MKRFLSRTSAYQGIFPDTGILLCLTQDLGNFIFKILAQKPRTSIKIHYLEEGGIEGETVRI